MSPPPAGYIGPVALAASKYASPQYKDGRFAGPWTMPRPADGTVATKDQAKSTPADSTIATKEQIEQMASTTLVPANPDAQLAVGLNEALKKEVEENFASTAKALQTAINSAKQILLLFQESVKKEDPEYDAKMHAAKELYKQLEECFEAIKGGKAAMQAFLDKQKDSMGLYYDSVLNEVIQSTHEEVNFQHQKLNLQHKLIMDHQHALKQYQGQVEPKIKEHAELKDRNSRLTLDKGLLKAEMDALNKRLAALKNDSASDAKNAQKWKEELEAALASKEELATKNDALNATVVSLQQLGTVNYQAAEKELREKTAALKKASEQHEQLKAEHKGLQKKFNDLSAQHSDLFSKSVEQSKVVKTLTSDVNALQKANKELTLSADKLGDLEKAKASLSALNEDLMKQLESSAARAKEAEEQHVQAKVQLEAKIKKLELENEELEIEHNDIMAKAADVKKMTAAMTTLKGENEKLRKTTQDLQKKVEAMPVAQGNEKAQAEEREKLKAKNAELEEDLAEWKDLATRAYGEYKDTLPKAEQAEQYRKACEAKDQEIEKLKSDLKSAVDTKQSNGTASNGNVSNGNASNTYGMDAETYNTNLMYWKNKYESLLDRISN